MSAPARPITPPEVRFWAKVDVRGPDDCWPWTAGRTGPGYGGFHPSTGRTVGAHVFAFQLAYGPVPDGHQVDHACHNGTDCPGGRACVHRTCCNPAHLEAVEPIENQVRSHCMRGNQDHCPNGHEYTAETTRFLPDRGRNGWRICLLCEQDRGRSRSGAAS